MNEHKDECENPKVSPEITVRLAGRIAEVAGVGSLEREQGVMLRLTLPDEMKETTPRQLIAHIAKQNPLLRDQIVRRDGTPRSSTRILLDGMPPDDLDDILSVTEDKTSRKLLLCRRLPNGYLICREIVIIVVVPCDG